MNHLSQEEKYMQRCLRLAQMAEGLTYPNPMVGSVIVYKNQIIGEGYHRKAGEPHAEVNAVHSVKDKSLLKHSTLYVNLEPCAHYGKTPPCSKLIIDHEIPNVVIGCIDSYSKVAGKGVKMMEAAGVKVKTGVLEQESLELNRRFFTFHNKKRPYIILKWAESQDGFVDIERTVENYGQPTWITNNWARRAVHKQRASEQAILIGTQTAIKDNPSLTLRDWAGYQPLRCVIDKQLRLGEQCHLMDQKCPTLVFNELKSKTDGLVDFVKVSEDKLIDEVLTELWKREIQSVIIEGGSYTLAQFIQCNLWDEAYRYIGDVNFEKGIQAPKLRILPNNQQQFGSSKLLVYRNNL